MNGLAYVYAGNNDFSKAEKLRYLYFGTDDTTYANANLKEIKLGSNPILEVLDLKNCSGLDGALDLSNKNNLQVLEAEGTTYSLITLIFLDYYITFTIYYYQFNIIICASTIGFCNYE